MSCRRLRFLGILPSTMDILLSSPLSSLSFALALSLARSLSHSLSLFSRGHSVSTRATPLRAREWRLSRLARPYQRASALPSSLPACFPAYLCLTACFACLLASPTCFACLPALPACLLVPLLTLPCSFVPD